MQNVGSVTTTEGMTAKVLRAVEERAEPYFTVDSKVTQSSGAPSSLSGVSIPIEPDICFVPACSRRRWA